MVKGIISDIGLLGFKSWIHPTQARYSWQFTQSHSLSLFKEGAYLLYKVIVRIGLNKTCKALRTVPNTLQTLNKREQLPLKLLVLLVSNHFTELHFLF